jgi:diguanylate cyclase (GGDEF)-like protein
MGERQRAAPSDLPSNGVPPLGDAWEPPPQETDRASWITHLAGLLLVAVTIGCVLLNDRFLSPREQSVLDVAVILMAAASAFFLSGYARRRNVDMERAYSSHLETLSRRLRDLAYRDGLTGLYNHRYFQEQLAHEVGRAQRYGHRLSVLMLDVDRFKEVNDTYGHLMGDTLLTYVAQLIATKLRTSDIAARYGGDEFAVILPETGQEKALAVAQKLGQAVGSDRRWQGALLENLGVGISFGVATFPDDGRMADDLLVCADRRLYATKARRTRRTRRAAKTVSPFADVQVG